MAITSFYSLRRSPPPAPGSAPSAESIARTLLSPATASLMANSRVIGNLQLQRFFPPELIDHWLLITNNCRQLLTSEELANSLQAIDRPGARAEVDLLLRRSLLTFYWQQLRELQAPVDPLFSRLAEICQKESLSPPDSAKIWSWRQEMLHKEQFVTSRGVEDYQLFRAAQVSVDALYALTIGAGYNSCQAALQHLQRSKNQQRQLSTTWPELDYHYWQLLNSAARGQEPSSSLTAGHRPAIGQTFVHWWKRKRLLA